MKFYEFFSFPQLIIQVKQKCIATDIPWTPRISWTPDFSYCLTPKDYLP